MTEFITTLVVGILVSVLGIINMTGNISSLHRYHRHRVSEENKKPFGRLVGIGTIIIGLTVIAFGALMFAAEKTSADYLVIVGTALMIVGLVVGSTIAFLAMKKYNGGIF